MLKVFCVKIWEYRMRYIEILKTFMSPWFCHYSCNYIVKYRSRNTKLIECVWVEKNLLVKERAKNKIFYVLMYRKVISDRKGKLYTFFRVYVPRCEVKDTYFGFCGSSAHTHKRMNNDTRRVFIWKF